MLLSAACSSAGQSNSNQSTSTTPSPSAIVTPPCSTQAFLDALGSKGGAESPTPSGNPTCVDGYALQIFTAGPGGQAAQFFFMYKGGHWTLIEGGNALPTKACSTIPANVLAKLGAQCPPAAIAP